MTSRVAVRAKATGVARSDPLPRPVPAGALPLHCRGPRSTPPSSSAIRQLCRGDQRDCLIPFRAACRNASVAPCRSGACERHSARKRNQSAPSRVSGVVSELPGTIRVLVVPICDGPSDGPTCAGDEVGSRSKVSIERLEPPAWRVPSPGRARYLEGEPRSRRSRSGRLRLRRIARRRPSAGGCSSGRRLAGRPVQLRLLRQQRPGLVPPRSRSGPRPNGAGRTICGLARAGFPAFRRRPPRSAESATPAEEDEARATCDPSTRPDRGRWRPRARRRRSRRGPSVRPRDP